MLYCKSELHASEPLTSQDFLKKPHSIAWKYLHSTACTQQFVFSFITYYLKLQCLLFTMPAPSKCIAMISQDHTARRLKGNESACMT